MGIDCTALLGIFCCQSKGIGEKRIACQKRHGFAVNTVIGGLSAAQIVIIHTRQIVVDQRIGMDHFQGTGIRKSRLGIAAEEAAKGQSQRRANALAARHQAVTAGFE